MEWVEEALDMAFRAIDEEELEKNINNQSSLLINEDNQENFKNSQNLNVENSKENSSLNNTTNNLSSSSLSVEPIYENIDEINKSNQEISSIENPIKSNKTSPIQSRSESPVKQTIQNYIESLTMNSLQNSPVKEESHYQVPQSSEPLYETPKHHRKPIPVYENIEILYPGVNDNGDETFALNNTLILEPPKEKPPPPPIDENDEDEDEIDGKKYATISPIKQQINNNEELSSSTTISPHKGGNVKRMNSTKRIKKELRNKRSSFLGIEGNEDDIFLELTVAPPPDMAQLLQEERRLEKQLYMKAGLYESSDTGDSRDSGVSENHSRQSSEPFTNSSEEHEDLLIKKEKEIIEVLEKEEIKQRTSENWSQQNNNNNNNHEENDAKIQCIEDQIREQEEVLRVERELLQLEQEELKRQRENLILRENLARRELAHGAKMLMSANHRSLQDINNASTNHYANIPNQIYQVEADYRKSMSDLADFNGQKRIPPTPPAKPLRSHLSVQDTRIHNINNNNYGGGLIKIAGQPIVSPTLSSSSTTTTTPTRVQHSQSTDEFVPLRNYQPTSAVHHGNMTRHTLHALSAAPKPKYTDGWVQPSKTNSKSLDKNTDSWLSYQQKRKSIPEGFNYNKHWLIQEAEQRRIDQQRGLRNSNVNNWNNTNGNNAIQRNGSSDNKPLPDAVIQTLTQRVQSKGLGERKRMDQPPPPPPIAPSNDSLLTTVTTPPVSVVSPINALPEGQQDKILSVSGKKKCSHCGDELGRGAAMIIESLRLFYHIQCFKCCVCHVQLGDGLNGTDVRVRNHKLHCHNCYSSDDGIKFSCV